MMHNDFITQLLPPFMNNMSFQTKPFLSELLIFQTYATSFPLHRGSCPLQLSLLFRLIIILCVLVHLNCTVQLCSLCRYLACRRDYWDTTVHVAKASLQWCNLMINGYIAIPNRHVIDHDTANKLCSSHFEACC